MRSYGQYCPVAQAMEILGERWTLLVVRELLVGSTRFSDLLKGLPNISRSVLAQRLASLEDAKVVERRGVKGRAGSEYHLTAAGQALSPVVEQCGLWAHRHLQRDYSKEELDPALLMWDMRRSIDPGPVPKPALVQFDFTGAPRGKQRYWLHLREDETDLCTSPPGFEVDLYVSCELRAMTQLWMGRLGLREALASGKLRLEGPAALQRAFPKLLTLNLFVHLDRASV